MEDRQKDLVFIPLVPLLIISSGSQHHSDDLKTSSKINFKDGSLEGLDFVVFDQIGRISESGHIEADYSSIRIDGTEFIIGDRGMRGEAYLFRAGLTFYNHRSQPNAITIFPHLFEGKIANFIFLLRLFSPGDLFAPIALVDDSGVSDLSLFGEYQEAQGNMVLSLSEIEDFESFHDHYLNAFRMVDKAVRDETGDKNLVSWAKRIWNALYFFNQSYFTKTTNRVIRGARNGNLIRLINLITALDSLCGDGAGSKKAIAENTQVFIGDIYKDIVERVDHFYSLRSDYIHANPTKLATNLIDKEIDELRSYVQKVILINLELIASEPFRGKFIQSNQRRCYELLQKVPQSIDLKEAFERVFQQKDLYGKPRGADDILRNWERQVGPPKS